jgi:Zn-dependent M28 family amino/carboxypeptidase
MGGCTPDAPSPEELAADVARMERPTNPERREALTEVLTEHGIAWELDGFEISPRPNYPRSEGANVVVTIGDGPADIVIGAHYDAVWLQDGTLSRGAVDNAASSIILARVAEALEDEELDHRVRIVWFDMEEIGLLGSTHYATTSDRPIAAAINLDVNGYGDTLFYGPGPEGEAETRMRALIADGCARVEASCMSFEIYPQSDYESFRRAGVPTVSLSVLPLAEAEELHDAMNPEPGRAPPSSMPAILRLIHTTDDTSDRIEPDGMLIAYHAVMGLVRKLDVE